MQRLHLLSEVRISLERAVVITDSFLHELQELLRLFESTSQSTHLHVELRVDLVLHLPVQRLHELLISKQGYKMRGRASGLLVRCS